MRGRAAEHRGSANEPPPQRSEGALGFDLDPVPGHGFKTYVAEVELVRRFSSLPRAFKLRDGADCHRV